MVLIGKTCIAIAILCLYNYFPSIAFNTFSSGLKNFLIYRHVTSLGIPYCYKVRTNKISAISVCANYTDEVLRADCGRLPVFFQVHFPVTRPLFSQLEIKGLLNTYLWTQ